MCLAVLPIVMKRKESHSLDDTPMIALSVGVGTSSTGMGDVDINGGSEDDGSAGGHPNGSLPSAPLLSSALCE